MTTQTSIKKLPPIKEDVPAMKQKIQDLEREVFQYKSRLDELRKAKNNLIIKKTTEYVKTGIPVPLNGSNREKSNNTQDVQQVDQPQVNTQYNEELERMVENLQLELNESKDLIAALRLENEELKNAMERNKRQFNLELADALTKNEEYKKEVKQWEVMYKEWMQMMEDRVTNINRTHQILQQCIRPPEETNQN